MSLLERDDLDQLDFTILEAQQVTPLVQRYTEEHLQELIEDNIIPECKAISQAMNLPRGFIEGIGYELIANNRFKIVNRWGTPSKPLALWFNYGTKDHGPKNAIVLHFISRQGKEVFTKWVRGVPRTMAMETGIELGKKRFIQSILLRSRQYVTKELDLVS